MYLFQCEAEHGVRSARSQVHLVTTYRFVFDAVVVEIQNVLVGVYFDVGEVFNRVNVIWIPLQSQTFFWIATETVEHQLLLFEHAVVQQVVDLFVVELQE